MFGHCSKGADVASGGGHAAYFVHRAARSWMHCWNHSSSTSPLPASVNYSFVGGPGEGVEEGEGNGETRGGEEERECSDGAVFVQDQDKMREGERALGRAARVLVEGWGGNVTEDAVALLGEARGLLNAGVRVSLEACKEEYRQVLAHGLAALRYHSRSRSAWFVCVCVYVCVFVSLCLSESWCVFLCDGAGWGSRSCELVP